MLKKIKYIIILCLAAAVVLFNCSGPKEGIYSNSKPYTRWWWFAAKIEKKDIEHQLDWLEKNNFGGVEIAFIYPVNRDPDAERIEWLSPEWTETVRYAKEYADRKGLGCDFTFGTLWPFGGTFVPDSDRTKVYGDPDFKQPLRLSWTHPVVGNVVDHMNKGAFERYAKVMGDALGPALEGSQSALFCDSWEVETKRIRTTGFDKEFEKRYGYDIKPYMPEILSPSNSGPRYDYMKLVSEYVINNFFIPFTAKCHELGAVSRVQCAGSPTDLIRAYANVDIPESEAMLYNPGFSKIPASAAALSGKKIVSAETFTCLYGWPKEYFLKEQTADLKLVVDALFAHGVNQVIWHGMPFNPAGVDSQYFYATVHVGEKGALSAEIPAFNAYMTRISGKMKKGKTYSDVAVYLPLEDSRITGEYPPELQMKWSWGAYEQRYIVTPVELKGYHPLWINRDFLQRGEFMDAHLYCGDACFSSLYIDVEYLDSAALDAILELAKKGFPVCLKRTPKEPGKISAGDYEERLQALLALENVSGNFAAVAVHPPLLESVTVGEALPDFWCREDVDAYYIFFSQPKAWNLTYPVSYGQAHTKKTVKQELKINVRGETLPVELVFKPYQSVLLKVVPQVGICSLPINFRPKKQPQPSAPAESIREH
ncbi:MAG: hypothetical protein KAW12_12530 [Candidatus Aminicenantes bacterium]|nr:hypothetical protein [Candidatus Aminicenantes bacterium]